MRTWTLSGRDPCRPSRPQAASFRGALTAQPYACPRLHESMGRVAGSLVRRSCMMSARCGRASRHAAGLRLEPVLPVVTLR